MAEARLRLCGVPAWIARNRELPFAERLERASAVFQGLPYRDDDVGEGRSAEFDRRPIFRLDRFDCHTYVETSLALAAARSGRQFSALVRALRYREGKVDFCTRNHLTIQQWMPHNVAAGLVRDVTAEVAGEAAQRETQVFDAGDWFNRLGPERLHGFQESAAARQERLARLRRSWTGPHRLAVRQCWLPLAAAVRAGEPFPGGARKMGMQVNTPLLARLPRSTVLLVRADVWTHMTLVVWRRGELLLRHASRGQERLIEHPLVPLLVNFARAGEARSLMVLEPLLG
jgi:hypothetical protein